MRQVETKFVRLRHAVQLGDDTMAGACAGWVVGTKVAFFMSRWCCGSSARPHRASAVGNLPEDLYLLNKGARFESGADS